MGKVIDLTGQIFGKWTVIKQDLNPPRKGHGAYWLCQCACGNPQLLSVASYELRSGHSKSCGCNNYNRRAREKKEGNPFLHKNLSGKIFGLLKVLCSSSERGADRSVVYICECECGNKIKVRGSHLTDGHTHSCGCLKSIGEAQIQQILQRNNIQFKKEKTFEDLSNDKGSKYRYDFYLPDYNRLIEFDGIQHYEYNDNGWNTKENFEKTQTHDKIKNEYALSHNIPLVRIPYWERDNITLEMLLGDKYLVKVENDKEETIF